MTKRFIGLCMVGVIAMAISACGPTELSSDPVSIEEETVAQEDTSSLEINFDGKSLLEIRTFIDAHKDSAGAEDVDKMVVLYHQRLQNKHTDLQEQFLRDTYLSALYGAIDENGVLQVEAIAEDSIRQETLGLLADGYCFTMAEGEYFLSIDYKAIYETYGDLLSAQTKPYYELMYKEFASDYWNASFQEVKNRADIIETLLKEYPNSPLREEEKEWLTAYIMRLFQIDVLNGSIDYETGLVKEEVTTLYRSILDSDLMVTKQAVEDMMAILESNNFTVKMDDQNTMDKIRALREKYTNETGAIVDGFYPLK